MLMVNYLNYILVVLSDGPRDGTYVAEPAILAVFLRKNLFA
jgi:hypothetical protein